MEHYDNICEYICDNRYSVLINFLSTVLGAFLGFIFALIVYWITEYYKRKNDRHNEKVKAYNTLKRFSLIIKSVIVTCENQNKAFKDHSVELKKSPLNFHLPDLLATNDRERLVNSDCIDLYHAFMLFDKENPDKFKDYKNTFNHADFLHKFYSDLFTQNEKHQNFLHSDLKIIRDNILSIAIKIGLLQKDIQLENPNGYNKNSDFIFLEKYRNIYLKLKKDNEFTDFEPYKTDFLIPLQLELFENINNQKFANEIASLIANAVTLMESLTINTNKHAKDFENLANDENIISALDFLKKIQTKIEIINEP